MVIIDIITILGRLTLDPAGMHCPAGDDAFVSSFGLVSDAIFQFQFRLSDSGFSNYSNSSSLFSY